MKAYKISHRIAAWAILLSMTICAVPGSEVFAVQSDEVTTRFLDCNYGTLGVHEHSDNCYNEEENLICGEADFVLHKHDEMCYIDGEMVCELEEVQGNHEHSDECYLKEMACEDSEHEHEEICYVTELVCEQQEGLAGHIHENDCYEDNILICSETQIIEHQHTENCFTVVGMDNIDMDDMAGDMDEESYMEVYTTSDGGINWGSSDQIGFSEGIDIYDDEGTHVFDVSGSQIRELKLPVSINIFDERTSEEVQVRISRYLQGVNGDIGRDGYTPEALAANGIQNNWSTLVTEDEVILTYHNQSGSAVHITNILQYSVDCWNVKSGEPFEINATITFGDGYEMEYILRGEIITGSGLEIGEYTRFDAYEGFGGADKETSYIQGYSQVYKDYFGVTQEEIESDKYIYDIAPILVKPTGQQPYDIEFEFKPMNGGYVRSAVYMLDARNNPDRVCIKIDRGPMGLEPSGIYKFSIRNDGIVFSENPDKKAVVSSNLIDNVDGKTYVIYLLVRWDKDKAIDSDKHIKLGGYVGVCHTGVDSRVKNVACDTISMYEGGEAIYMSGDGVYAATYNPNYVESKSGLSSLAAGYPARVEFTTDFFSLNEARRDEPGSIDKNKGYRMEAVIDLSFMCEGNDSSNMKMLGESDYQIRSYRIGLIDNYGSWSKDMDGSLNIGWKDFEVPEWAKNSWIEVYGSGRLTGYDWSLIGYINAAEAWAINQDRAFTMNSRVVEGDGLVRLKVVYDSRLTTALRVGYSMELLPTGSNVKRIVDSGSDTATLVSWLRYTVYAYKLGSWVPHLGFPTWAVVDNDRTINEVRKYDVENPPELYHGLSLDDNCNDHPDRNFARALIGKSDDAAGMMVGQILYEQTNQGLNVVGSKNSSSASDSHAHKKDVNRVGEVVYEVSGALVCGSKDQNGLDSRRDIDLSENMITPYTATRQRYYILMPEGFKLNRNPNGEHNESRSTAFISPSSLLYTGNKAVYNGWANNPVSGVTIPGMSTTNSWGGIREMWWGDCWNSDGDVLFIGEYGVGNKRLAVLERTVDVYDVPARYDLWGDNHNYFWGRGFSFSMVPIDENTYLPSGEYTTQFWCQYLSDDGDPLPVDIYARDISSQNIEDFNKAVSGITGLNTDDGSTLLYIKSSFRNYPVLGGSLANIRVKSDNDSAYDAVASVSNEEAYSYAMTYTVDGIDSSDVVLWSTMESCECKLDHEWHGTISGINLNGYDNAEVYVKYDTFNTSEYVGNANVTWLNNPDKGWVKIDPTTFSDWDKVGSIALYFKGYVFSDFSNRSVTVYLEMEAPSISEITRDQDRVEYYTHNELIFSDRHSTTTGSYASGCVKANPAKVNITIPERDRTGTLRISKSVIFDNEKDKSGLGDEPADELNKEVGIELFSEPHEIESYEIELYDRGNPCRVCDVCEEDEIILGPEYDWTSNFGLCVDKDCGSEEYSTKSEDDKL